MKIFSKYLGIGTITFLFLMVINTLWDLFHLSRENSSKVTTFLGITINNKITTEDISTTFGLTFRTLIACIIFLIVVLITGYIIEYKIFKKKT